MAEGSKRDPNSPQNPPWVRSELVHTERPGGRAVRSMLRDIYRYVSDLLERGRFEEVDTMLVVVAAEVSIYPLSVLIGCLTITYMARAHLPGRVRLLDAVDGEITRLGRDADRVGLLGGLRD